MIRTISIRSKRKNNHYLFFIKEEELSEIQKFIEKIFKKEIKSKKSALLDLLNSSLSRDTKFFFGFAMAYELDLIEFFVQESIKKFGVKQSLLYISSAKLYFSRVKLDYQIAGIYNSELFVLDLMRKEYLILAEELVEGSLREIDFSRLKVIFVTREEFIEELLVRQLILGFKISFKSQYKIESSRIREKTLVACCNKSLY